MKKIIFITLLALITTGLSAQKEVRKAIRSGNSAYNDQRYGAAEAEYNKAVKENPASKEASFNLANTYYRQQKWDDAVKEYQHYLTLENEDPLKMSSAWSNMGNTFLKKKANEKGQGQQAPLQPGQQPDQQQQQADNLKLSMEAYKNALRLNPRDDKTRYNLAVVQKMIQDKEGDGGGGGDNKDQQKDQKKDQKDQNQNQNQNQNKDQKQDQKQEQQNQNQMSQDNMQQILQAIEQDEKNTQERVNQAKAQERKQKNENNRKQNKDW